MDADCSNTDGSFNCTCQDGFKGDGTNCTGMVTIRIPVGHCPCLLETFNSYVGSAGALPRPPAVVTLRCVCASGVKQSVLSVCRCCRLS